MDNLDKFKNENKKRLLKENEIRKILVNNIRNECANLGISVAEMERITGLPNGTISRFRNSIPGIDKVYWISQFLNISIDDLLGNYITKEGDLDMHVSLEFNKLTDNQKDLVMNLIYEFNKDSYI